MDEEEETSSCGSARTTLQLDLDQCDEAAIDFICERLNSKNDTLICETVLQVKHTKFPFQIIFQNSCHY